MTHKYFTLLVVLLFSAILTKAQEFKTYTYFINDSISLDLDLFTPKPQSPTPLVIYVHGGGFSNGNRTAGHKLAKYLVTNNMACATISYTLYMQGKDFGCNGILSEKVRAFQIASNQLWLATDFLLKKSTQLHIDTSKVFIAGSSAGAETVLHAAYWNRKLMQQYEHKLTPSFKYAGVIAGAGAIMDLNLITTKNVIPTMLFHGDADPLVPYGTAAHHYCPPNSSGWLMFFGSQSIATHLHNLNGSYHFTTFQDGGHSYAGAYFYQNHQPIVDFMTRVIAGEKFKSSVTIKANK